MAKNYGLAGLVSSERLVLSLAIALALLSLACTVWGCRGCRFLGGGGGGSAIGSRAFGPVGHSASGRRSTLSYAPWDGRRGGPFEGFEAADAVGAAAVSADPQGTASAAASPESAAIATSAIPASVVASPGVVVPPLVLKTRSNESGTEASRNLEKRILEDGRNIGKTPRSGEGRLR